MTPRRSPSPTGPGRTAAVPMRARPAGRCRAQQGMTLVVGLIFLLLLTILGVTAINMNTLQERMAGNMKNQDIAFQAAESTLRGGEAYLGSLPSYPLPTNAQGGIWNLDAPAPAVINGGNFVGAAVNLWATDGTAYTPLDFNSAMIQGYYVVEQMQFVPDNLNIGQGPKTGRYFYRITAYAPGPANTGAQAMVQSTYVIRFN